MVHQPDLSLRRLTPANHNDFLFDDILWVDRAHMHLDTVFTMLDVDKVTVFPDVVNKMEAYSIRPGDERALFSVTKEENFLSAVTDALDINRREVIPIGGDSNEAAREQWDDGNNI